MKYYYYKTLNAEYIHIVDKDIIIKSFTAYLSNNNRWIEETGIIIGLSWKNLKNLKSFKKIIEPSLSNKKIIELSKKEAMMRILQ